MPNSKEAALRLNAQLIIASIIGGQTVTAATWLSNVATLTIGAHSLIVGNKVVVYGINPAGYNGLATITAITATTISYALGVNPGAYVSGGAVTAQCQLGMLELAPASTFFSNLALSVSATTGPAAIVLPATNDNFSGQREHYDLMFQVLLYQGKATNQSNDFVAMENTWTAVRDALLLQANWTGVSLPPPDGFNIRTPNSRTDGIQSTNVWQWEFELKFIGAVAVR